MPKTTYNKDTRMLWIRNKLDGLTLDQQTIWVSNMLFRIAGQYNFQGKKKIDPGPTTVDMLIAVENIGPIEIDAEI